MGIRTCRHRSGAWVLSHQASFWGMESSNSSLLLSVPLWIQERSSLGPHLPGWMRVPQSQALGRTLA